MPIDTSVLELCSKCIEFQDLWRSLVVPEDADLLKSLASGRSFYITIMNKLLTITIEGLQATASETVIPKPPIGKKKGKRAAIRQRQTRITNVHLKEDIDLTRDYVANPASTK